MIKNIKNLFRIGTIMLLGVTVVSCEAELDDLGSQFFDGNSAEGLRKDFSVIAYNINNNDTIRTDATRLGYATLGAFNEGVFGLQKSSYVSQVRLALDNPTFGTNAVLDSAVLVMNPIYNTDSVTTSTYEDYVYPVGNVPAKKVVSNYSIDKYGNDKIGGKTILNIKVNEVTDFLGSSTASVYSNKTVNTSGLIGSKNFDGIIRSVKITKDEDNSELSTTDAAIRIKLDSTFFQNKIIAKSGSPELNDAASFIRYFKGIKISVDNNDGYIFKFAPSDLSIRLYYKNDKVEAGVTTRPQSLTTLNMADSNARFSQITNERVGTAYASAMGAINPNTGDAKVFMQGMGGSSMGIKIPENTIATLRNLYNNDKAGIISAKIRVYTDVSTWKNAFPKPEFFLVKQKNAKDFLTDINALAFTTYSLVKPYDIKKDLAYYDYSITKTLKDVVETNAENKEFVIDLGNYTVNSTNGALLGLNFNDRAYNPMRTVFVGTDFNNTGVEVTNSLNAQLKITYGKK